MAASDVNSDPPSIILNMEFQMGVNINFSKMPHYLNGFAGYVFVSDLLI